MSRKAAKTQRFALLASLRLGVRFLIADKDYAPTTWATAHSRQLN
jgi:hypothetical protein